MPIARWVNSDLHSAQKTRFSDSLKGGVLDRGLGLKLRGVAGGGLRDKVEGRGDIRVGRGQFLGGYL